MLRYLAMDLGAGFKLEKNNFGLKNPDFKTTSAPVSPRPGTRTFSSLLSCPGLDLKRAQVSRDPPNSVDTGSHSSVRDRDHLLARARSYKITCSREERREVMNRVCESSRKYSRSSAFLFKIKR